MSETPSIELPEAILFDWDGTLVDTIPGLRLAHNHVRTSFGYPEWTEKQFYENLKHSSRELYPRIYGDKGEEAIRILYDFIARNHLDHLSILPGAAELVTFLINHSIPTAVVSNKLHEYLVREIEHVGWNTSFLSVIGAGQAKRDKPHADPLHLALKAFDIRLNKNNIWYVGDTITDLLAARELGCHAILLTHGEDRQDLIDEFRPLIVVENCLGLNDLLREILPAKNKNKAC